MNFIRALSSFDAMAKPLENEGEFDWETVSTAITGDVQRIYPEHYKWPAKHLEVKWGQHESVNAFKRWGSGVIFPSPIVRELTIFTNIAS